MVVPGCLGREQWIFCTCCMCLGGPSHFLRVRAHMRMGEARLSGHNLGSVVGH